ncbi:UAA transporter, partial [Blyttiomyces sp. JEL0837]
MEQDLRIPVFGNFTYCSYQKIMEKKSIGWFGFSILVDNKVILKLFHFNFPWILTAIHALLSCLGSSILVHGLKTVTPTVFTTRREIITILLFSVLYTVNIAVSNVSLNLVSLPFHQIVRSTNPAVTLTLERILFRKRPASVEVHLSLLLVIIGVGLATLGEYEFSLYGLGMTLLGVLLSSLKGIFTHSLLVGSLKMHPLDLLWRMSGLAFFQCLGFSWVSGEWGAFVEFLRRLEESGGNSGVGTNMPRGNFVALSDAEVSAVVNNGGEGNGNGNGALGLFQQFAAKAVEAYGRRQVGGGGAGAGDVHVVGSTMNSGSTSASGVRLTVNLLYLALLANGVIAFFLNYVSFSANRKVGALSMTVAGNVKQSMSIMLSVWIFGYIISYVNGL